ncbi:MAG: hypothetical protein DRK00_06865 [Thermoprotei archaeon]|nr:MAG: hypothetical protein DRK00_06865 [Thermoprotei archaeon]
MGQEELKVFRTTLTPTVRGAISKVRRWFYATFYSKERGDVREASKENWTRLARILVEKTSEEGVSDRRGGSRYTITSRMGYSCPLGQR